MPELYLQSVIVKKPMLLGLARKKAQEILQNRARRYVRETEEHYIFRNIPLKHFNPEKIVVKKFNDTISLVYGEFKSDNASTSEHEEIRETPGQDNDLQDMRNQSTQEEFQITPINDKTSSKESLVQGVSDALYERESRAPRVNPE